MGYNDIYEENQGKYETSNRLIFKNFLEYFKAETKLNLDNILKVYEIDTTDPA